MSVREHDNGINNERRVLSTSPKEGKKERRKNGRKIQKQYFLTRIPLESTTKTP